MSDNTIEISHVGRRFGKTVALDDVSLDVPQGMVMGLIGENGAGKTTLIKHVLGLLKAKAGSVRVFGLDPVLDPPGVLGRIGYLSETRDLPEWMRIGELMRYSQPFHPKWDQAYAEELRETFELDSDQKIKTLSKGQRARTALLIALAHRPDLLLLDEPSSGLDPIVRRDILSAVIRTIAEEGRTVLLSSHLVDEVERVADSVAMIHHGQMVLTDSVDNIKEAHHRLILRFDEPQPEAPQLPGALSCVGGPLEWTFLCNGQIDQLKEAAKTLDAQIVEQSTPTLEDIFIALVKSKAF
ncbi:MAG: ABC transporter ATP-binding protein [Planctomycetota bacterium]|nr:ABC transporter ATP-binding protein [Planctomycetota bacterium]